MKSYLVAIFVSIVSLDAVGVQCSRDETHVAAAAAATTTAHVTAVDSTLPQERPSACSISVRAWTSDPTPHKAVWDIRDANLRMRRAIVGVTPMSPAAIRGAILIAGQSILLIGDSLDPFAAHDVCASLRGRGHQVFVLDAGDRAWRAQGKAQSASLSVRDAELSIESAALWLEDSATRWISDDGAKHAPRIPTEAIMRTIYFRDDSTSSAQLRSRLESSMAFDERSWWVDATQKELEHYAEQGRSVAASRNVSLAKPCGVN